MTVKRISTIDSKLTDVLLLIGSFSKISSSFVFNKLISSNTIALSTTSTFEIKQTFLFCPSLTNISYCISNR
ncbi:hypothetical protein PPL_01235 [Heterostelium album PN500]|uniref:Uncharacterized protein n=1 Tax=Heterostelium pallidum (strain ATCC 26659 / Pp 5 / PN500) TaxID=670386 RepID=D3AYH5_HETP5|nr:hypothetical protein PPL_01235 [Heterostelium album PN500]EFA86002.1 hypothetical protein PPL_01235 [Heterostelium album PN500]|eukprot:XP_020438108.1 hypothetical protein PPL_01235 [Heterostelium album PN500]